MKNMRPLPAILILVSMILTACGAIAVPTSTPTVEPSETLTPTETHTALPTETPVPAETPTLQPNGMDKCPISTDSTYGYTQENPIKVGGDFFEGAARERLYLDNLQGPNGEPILYHRTGSIPFADTILDAYEITGLNEPVVLYLDLYLYTAPQAPVGFTCFSAFSLDEP